MNLHPPNRRYKWYVVGMLWWIAFFNYADRQSVFSLFPLLSHEFHLSNLQLGLLGSSFACGTATGFMNMMGWLAGGGTAPAVVGFLADRIGLSRSVALTAFSYLAASILLSIGAFRFAPRDTQRMEALLRSEVLDPI